MINREKWMQLFSKSRHKQPFLIIVVIGSLLLLAGGSLFPDKEPSDHAQPALDETAYTQNLEKRLCRILEKIEGAGNVQVLVTLDNTGRIDLAQTNKTDADSQENNPLLRRNGSSEQPIVVDTHPPAVRGAVIVATGAGDPHVRDCLHRAAKAALGVGANRIEVLEGS